MPNGPLDKLRGGSEWLARLTGCSPADATIFVLTGEKLQIGPMGYRISRAFGTARPPAGEIEITIRSPGVSSDDVAKLYTRLRQELWGVEHAVEPSRDDLELARFYADTRDATWFERLRRWNREHPDRSFYYPDALRVACTRAWRRCIRPPS